MGWKDALLPHIHLPIHFLSDYILPLHHCFYSRGQKLLHHYILSHFKPTWLPLTLQEVGTKKLLRVFFFLPLVCNLIFQLRSSTGETVNKWCPLPTASLMHSYRLLKTLVIISVKGYGKTTWFINADKRKMLSSMSMARETPTIPVPMNNNSAKTHKFSIFDPDNNNCIFLSVTKRNVRFRSIFTDCHCLTSHQWPGLRRKTVTYLLMKKNFETFEKSAGQMLYFCVIFDALSANFFAFEQHYDSNHMMFVAVVVASADHADLVWANIPSEYYRYLWNHMFGSLLFFWREWREQESGTFIAIFQAPSRSLAVQGLSFSRDDVFPIIHYAMNRFYAAFVVAATSDVHMFQSSRNQHSSRTLSLRRSAELDYHQYHYHNWKNRAEIFGWVTCTKFNSDLICRPAVDCEHKK